MSPVSLQNGEVQYYTSPVLVKNNRYTATITNLRIIIDGAVSREFSVTNIISAQSELINGKEPGIKLLLATQNGQKEMVWTFPLDDIFKKGEQEAWLTAIQKTAGENVVSREMTTPDTVVSAVNTIQQQEDIGNTNGPNLIRGESILINTSGVLVKHSFYTAYLTNLRFILMTKEGKIGREFAIAELKDAAELNAENGNAEIAVSVGMQSGLKQMVLSFPTREARDAWMRELQKKLPQYQQKTPTPAVTTERIGTFVPATNERVLVSTPNVKIKNHPMVVHLTNTRFIIDSSSGIMGEFAINTLTRAVRMSSELGEPGIALTLTSSSGRKDMHLIFMSMGDREAWMDNLKNIIPEERGSPASTAPRYTVTSVEPHTSVNSQNIACPKCGALNPSTEQICSLCGSELHPQPQYSSSRRTREPRLGREPRSEYNGSFFGFIFRPRDAFNYHAHESPKAAFPLCLLAGVIWAVITTLLLAYVVPNIFNLDENTFPILNSLQNNFGMVALLIFILLALWILGILIHGAIAGGIAHLASPGSRFGECMAIVMRSSFAYAICGWVPVFGLIAAGIWTGICSFWGLRETQEMSTVTAVIAAFLGVIVVYAIDFIIGVA